MHYATEICAMTSRARRALSITVSLVASLVPPRLGAQPDHWDFTTFENGGTPVRLRLVRAGRLESEPIADLAERIRSARGPTGACIC